MHTERERPLCTHNRTEIASVEKHERETSQKQIVSHRDIADTPLPCQKSQPVWASTRREYPLCIPASHPAALLQRSYYLMVNTRFSQ